MKALPVVCSLSNDKEFIVRQVNSKEVVVATQYALPAHSPAVGVCQTAAATAGFFRLNAILVKKQFF